MSLPELKQAYSLISQASHILLIVPQRASFDAISSMIALYLVLQSTKEDHVDEVSPQHVPTALQFLPGSSQVAMAPRKQSEIVLDIAGPTAIGAVRSQPLQGGLRIHLSLPDNVDINKDQLEVSVRSLPYDLVITFGATDLEALGPVFAANADFFYNTPVINIDHRAANEHFGTVNLVDITAGSTAEVAYDLITTFPDNPIDDGVATALYAGIVSGTDSFQKPSTTPRSFQAAARLMEADADRESVIQHIIKTKPLSLLKLTGRLYARLRYDEHIQLFWSLVRPKDFTDSDASTADLPRAMYELANNIAGFHAAFVLSENEQHDQYKVFLLLGKGLLQRRDTIQKNLAATRDNGLMQIKITASSLEEAENTALEKIRDIIM
ncbi:MAG: DHH family phosphoesterase [bacterium]|nr:DHH family phosphoesterase [bacterium]